VCTHVFTSGTHGCGMEEATDALLRVPCMSLVYPLRVSCVSLACLLLDLPLAHPPPSPCRAWCPTKTWTMMEASKVESRPLSPPLRPLSPPLPHSFRRLLRQVTFYTRECVCVCVCVCVRARGSCVRWVWRHVGFGGAAGSMYWEAADGWVPRGFAKNHTTSYSIVSLSISSLSSSLSSSHSTLQTVPYFSHTNNAHQSSSSCQRVANVRGGDMEKVWPRRLRVWRAWSGGYTRTPSVTDTSTRSVADTCSRSRRCTHTLDFFV
jgi:hypothetical protein